MTKNPKPKLNYSSQVGTMHPKDDCRTPPYALGPLLPYLRLGRIWEPAAGKHKHILVQALKVAGYDAVGTDIAIAANQDFFGYSADDLCVSDEIIITNPPFGTKVDWFKHCWELGIPFALLMPVETLAIQDLCNYVNDDSFGVMILSPRVDFGMPNEGWYSSAQFPVAWFTRWILPRSLMHAPIFKPKRDIYRQRLTKKGESFTQWGWGNWIEQPLSFDREAKCFSYEDGHEDLRRE